MIKKHIVPAITVMILSSILIKYNVNKHEKSALFKERNLTLYEKALVDEYKLISSSHHLNGEYNSKSMASQFKDEIALWIFLEDGSFQHIIETNNETLNVSGKFNLTNSVITFSDLAGAIALIPPEVAINKEKDKAIYFILPGGVKHLLKKVVK